MTKPLPSKPEREIKPVPEADKYFSTTDISCAAALLMRGFEMSTVDKGDIRKAKFVFKGCKGISETIKDFWDDRLMVDAQGYFNCLKRLKNQLYSEQ